MSWRLLLSEYPNSLLANDRALKLLVLLEWAGALTEDQLEVELKTERSKIVGDVLSLHKSKCIEYSSKFLKVTERGRRLIDRLSLESDVIEFVLRPLPIPDSSKPQMKEILSRFRTRAWDKYLLCSSAMHSWRQAIKNVPFKQDVANDDAAVGALTILLSELAVWMRDDPQEQLNALASEHESPFLSLAIPHRLASDPPIQKSLAWLKLADSMVQSKDPWPELHNTKEAGLGLFLVHFVCRSLLETNDWRNEWSRFGRSAIVLDACSSGLEAVHRLAEHGSKNWFDRALGLRQRPVESSSEVFQDGTIRRELDDLLWRILAATSFEELLGSTGLGDLWLEQLLGQIREKCVHLLKDKETKSGEVESRPRRPHKN